MVWKVGPQGALVATSASLRVVRVLRAERNVVLVLEPQAPSEPGFTRPTPPGSPTHQEDEDGPGSLVTQEQLQKALQSIWEALRKAGIRG